MIRLIDVYKSLTEEIKNPAELKNLIQHYQSQLTQHGITVKSQLGQGTQGIAFSTSEGKVLKVTQDRSEANAAALLKGKSFKNVYKVFEVFEFGNYPYYGIYQEHLQKIGWGDPLEKLYYAGTQMIFNDIAENKRKPEEATVEIQQVIQQRFAPADHSEMQKIADQILNGLKEIHTVGIVYRDLSIDNTMKRGAEYVLIDFGYSKSPPTDIEKL